MRNKFIITCVIVLFSFLQARSYTNLTAEQVHAKLVDADTLLLLDVREVSEYRSEHIAEPEGFLPLTPANMPMSSKVLEQNYSRLPRDRDILVYCASGNRSVSASAFLDSKGFTRIYNMTGGFSSWPFEKRSAGFGDHSGAWIGPDKPGPVVITCPVEGNSSTLTIPPTAIPGGDSLYVELHLVGDLVPQPEGVPVSDIRGLYRVTVLDRFGLSQMTADSLVLNDLVALHLYPEPNPYSMPPSMDGMTVFVPEKGWVPVAHTLDNIGFHFNGHVLRRWINLEGFYPLSIAEDRTVSEQATGIYPNPFNGTLTIDAPKNAQIRIYDINGRFVSNVKTGTWTPGRELGSGIYVISLYFKDEIHVQRVLYLK